jgi:hypothetical protein
MDGCAGKFYTGSEDSCNCAGFPGCNGYLAMNACKNAAILATFPRYGVFSGSRLGHFIGGLGSAQSI